MRSSTNLRELNGILYERHRCDVMTQVEPMPTTSRPFVSFKADGKYYFIQGHDMADKELLKILLGRELKEHENESIK